jgi:hypothetical protein
MSCTFNAQKKPVVVETPLKEFLNFIGKLHLSVYEERILDYDMKIDDGLASVWLPYEFCVDVSHSV